MQATNDSINFLRDEKLLSKIAFKGEAIQVKPKLVNDKYAIQDEETLHKCQEMSNKLKAKYPSMKPARIARKVAEYFKLKPLKDIDKELREKMHEIISGGNIVEPEFEELIGYKSKAEKCALIAKSYAEDKVKELPLKNAEIHGGYIHSLRVDNSKLNDKVKEAKELLKEAKEQLSYHGSQRAILVERQIKTFLESGNI